MGRFKDESDVYAFIGRLFKELAVDPDLAPRFKRANTTVQYQLGRLDQLSPALQEAMLKSAISDLDAEVANVKTIAQAWSRGDTSTIERLPRIVRLDGGMLLSSGS